MQGEHDEFLDGWLIGDALTNWKTVRARVNSGVVISPQLCGLTTVIFTTHAPFVAVSSAFVPNGILITLLPLIVPAFTLITAPVLSVKLTLYVLFPEHTPCPAFKVG